MTDRIAQVRGFLFGHSGRNEELFGDALGLALEATGDAAAAVEAYGRAIKIDPSVALSTPIWAPSSSIGTTGKARSAPS